MSLAARAHRGLVASRRRRFEARVAAAARLAGATLDVRVAPTARIGGGVRVRVADGAGGTLHIGDHARLDDGVEIRVAGGELRIGDWAELRSGAALMVKGRCEIGAGTLLSWGAVIHCDDAVRIGHHSSVGEHVTITDSTHHHAPGGWHLDSVSTQPVCIGDDTWVAAKATITPGVTIGDRCVIGAGAVVTHDVPDHHLAVGVPARSRPR